MEPITKLDLVYNEVVENEETGDVSIKAHKFSVRRRVPSAALRAELRKIAERYGLAEIDAVVKQPMPEDASKEQSRLEWIREKPEEVKSTLTAKYARANDTDLCTLEMLREIIDVDQIKEPKYRDLVEQDVTDAFYQGLDMEAVEEFVRRFRSRNNIG